MSQTRTAAVIGAGIAGTSAAYRLQQEGFETTLFEVNDRVGGRIWSIWKGDFLMDLGTSAYLGTYREAIELVKEVGLEHELAEWTATGAAIRNGKPYYFDYTRPLRTVLTTPYLSPKAKLLAIKIGLQVVKHRKSLGYDSYDDLQDIDNETVREWCRRELNEELLQYVGRPLVSGTWVADDADTSVSLMVWSVRNMLVQNIYNLTSGVVGLPNHLATYVKTRLEHEVTNVTDNGSDVEVTFTAGGQQQTEHFDTCVIATPVEPAMDIYPQMDTNTREFYQSVSYRKLGSICLGLSERPKDPATYYLVPPVEDPDVIAVIADHNKAPNRAPDHKGLLTVLLSHEYLERSEHLSDDDVLDYAVDRASRYHPKVPSTLEESVVVRWQRSVPTIDRGKFGRISDYNKRLDRFARVQFASDSDRIPGLNGGLVSGLGAAKRLSDAAQSRRLTSRTRPA
ncbi:NAD(P)/FAD-dependent oxidoreductase [Actinomycetospora sp. TBRC 11914]|uniref:protoporphyrinogen/coproporphyrinogen oxidase n=1 Tax=Actinomycetospora sp. TBRC 11914 TaxID=2729387 RepID=UPI00145F84F1|nr:FAD-dependent oxidoreductase [Actinomycetospora sp. TBRC 11914]NMO91691.1 FAD-dependent oxidoreductase [Actinomycetospora sp. TBRC 11914]